MADVTGPIMSMPGSSHAVPEGMNCDDHPETKATHRIQGETDSFGCEMIDMCDACFAIYVEQRAATALQEATGTCEWCKESSFTLKDQRDYEEGLYGRLYKVCKPCRDAERKRLDEEFDYD